MPPGLFANRFSKQQFCEKVARVILFTKLNISPSLRMSLLSTSHFFPVVWMSRACEAEINESPPGAKAPGREQ
jgi:hypothetical protein